MQITIEYPNGKKEIFASVKEIEDAGNLRYHNAGRDIKGLIFFEPNGALHRRNFSEIKSFKIEN